MKTPLRRPAAIASLALALALAPSPGAALAPAFAGLIKQMVQQSVTSLLKDTLLDSLRGMGCKGIALANAISALETRGGGSAALRGMAGAPGITVLPGAMPALPPGVTLSPEHAAALAQMQRAMAQPLTPAQTASAIDEIAELGLMPPAIQTEMKQCLTLLPQTAPMLGMAMAMLQPMLPQLRDARAQMRALPPAEQDEMAALIADELKALPAGERAQFVEQLDGGFFPGAVAAGVKARLAGTR